MNELQDKVAAFPAELEQSVKSDVQEVKERLTAEFNQKEELLKKALKVKSMPSPQKFSPFKHL